MTWRLLVVVAAMLPLIPLGSSGAAAIEGPGSQVWATRYDGPVSHADAASDVALSPDGSILFVTGISNGGAATHTDSATLAYDAATGAQLWEQRYDRSGMRDGSGELIVSPDGSTLFVRTESWSRREQITEWTILAYDASTGAPIWVTRSTRLTYYDIAISPDGSTLFVTGSDLTASDFATAAYDASTGTRRWVVRYGPGEGANGIAVSPDGSTVFVTGYTDESRFPLVRSDFATVAYGAANGDRLWASAYDGGRGDYPSALDLSADGSTVFVTGSSHAGRQQQAYGTVAYNASTGAELWRTRYLGPPSGPDVPMALAASPDGSTIFVTGWSTGSELDGDEYYEPSPTMRRPVLSCGRSATTVGATTGWHGPPPSR
jgi:WD40 repeat protein